MRLDARAHRDRDARVGAREQLVAETVALGAEREHRAWGQPSWVERVAVGVQREQRPPGSSQLLQARQPGDGQRVVQAGGAAQGVGVPGVVAAGGEHAGCARGGGHAHARPHVAEVARILEQHDRRVAAVREHCADIDRWALGERHHSR